MAGDGVGIFHLQSVEIGVCLQRLVALRLCPFEGRHYALEKLLLRVARQRRRVAEERVEHDFAVDFGVMVGKFQRYIGKTESEARFRAVDTLHHRHVAVGDKIYAIVVFAPEIVVFSHQEAVAGHEFLLAVEDTVADAEVIDSGALVAAGDDDGLRHAVAVVAVAEGLNHEFARESGEIRR